MLDLVVAASVVSLINLAQVAAANKVPGAVLLALVPMWLVIVKNLFVYPALTGFRVGPPTTPSIAWLTLTFVLLVEASLLRGLPNRALPGLPQTVAFLATVALFSYAVFSRFRVVEPDRVVRAVAAGVGIYLLLNLAAYLAGLKPPPVGGTTTQGDAVMLSLFGAQAQRVFFPLSTSLNGYAVMSGLGVTFAITMFKGGLRLFWICVLVAGVFGVLLVDSRGAAVFTLGTLAFMLLPRFVKRRAHWLVIIAPIVSIATIALLVSLAISGASSKFKRDLIDVLIRPDVVSEDVGAARAVVWEVAVEELQNPKAIHAIGFGAYGHFASGISRYYDTLFMYLDRPELATLHNATLQYLMDTGYIGATLFFALLFLLARTWLAPVAVFLVLMGATEAMPTIYFRDALYVFVMLCAYCTLRPSSPLPAMSRCQG